MGLEKSWGKSFLAVASRDFLYSGGKVEDLDVDGSTPNINENYSHNQVIQSGSIDEDKMDWIVFNMT